MPRVHQRVQLIEDWLERNMLTGKEAVFRLLCVEDNGEDYFKCSVEGRRYKQFGIHRSSDGYRVTHLRTGGRYTRPFSSEIAARRFVSGISPLHEWSKVQWADIGEDNVPPEVVELCGEMADYCDELPGEYPNLMAYLHEQLPPEEKIDFKPAKVKFGGSGFASKKVKKFG